MCKEHSVVLSNTVIFSLHCSHNIIVVSSLDFLLILMLIFKNRGQDLTGNILKAESQDSFRFFSQGFLNGIYTKCVSIVKTKKICLMEIYKIFSDIISPILTIEAYFLFFHHTRNSSLNLSPDQIRPGVYLIWP